MNLVSVLVCGLVQLFLKVCWKLKYALTPSSGKAGKREAAVRRRSKVRHSDNLKKLDFGDGRFSSMILMLFRIMMMLI